MLTLSSLGASQLTADNSLLSLYIHHQWYNLYVTYNQL